MAGLLHVMVPGVPHHVAHYGKRRERTFFKGNAFALYLDLLADAAEGMNGTCASRR